VTRPNDQQFEVNSTAKSLTRRAVHQFQVLSNSVRQWHREYLMSLYERSLKSDGDGKDRIKVEDVVLLREVGTVVIVCAIWKQNKVVEPIKERDGRVQFTIVQLLTKTKLSRPIQH